MNLYKWLSRPGLIALYSDTQTVKNIEQIRKDCVEVSRAFNSNELSDNVIMSHINNQNIFKIKAHNELIASVYLRKTKYYTSTSCLYPFTYPHAEEQDAVEIYSLYVSEKYRKHGYARLLLYMALADMKEHYGLSNKHFVSLHLNPDDLYMDVSFAFYYSMNFKKASFVNHSPSSLAFKFPFQNLLDPLDIIQNPLLSDAKGRYLALYTRYCDFLPWNHVRNKHLISAGKRLRRILNDRKLMYDD